MVDGGRLKIEVHAFEPFFTTKDVGRRSVLGLSMVHGFVDLRSGLRVLSASGYTEDALRTHGETDSSFNPLARRLRGILDGVGG